ncbi:hypothetical protein PI23P_08215 [Polaribacter irgensii 23-P]|uniref:Uncharacterized protein n=1 Tax=Polaribacter irgensii 23-P TaxID=313594 RepID=A4BZK2_9FLAO|nr:hypothetical protein PI23P_08215 [Polaribacter irgensii 23-P]
MRIAQIVANSFIANSNMVFSYWGFLIAIKRLIPFSLIVVLQLKIGLKSSDAMLITKLLRNDIGHK